MRNYTDLASRIQAELDNLQMAVNRALELGNKAKTSGDDGYWDGVALNMHGYYSGVEHIFEDIARTVEDASPSGANWHTDLLIQMNNEVNGIRPLVISDETRITLDAFRGLHHIIRNVYAFNLRPARLDKLLNQLPHSFETVRSDLMKFIQFLETV
jgi:hypothetical protein